MPTYRVSNVYTYSDYSYELLDPDPDPSAKYKQPLLQKKKKILNIILHSELGVSGYEQKMEMLCQNLKIMNADRNSKAEKFFILLYLYVSRKSRKKKTKVRPDYSSAPSQLALCLRLAYSDLKGESCYAVTLDDSITPTPVLHNTSVVI